MERLMQIIGEANIAGSLVPVSVVILSYNRKDELMRNLPPLCEAAVVTGFELIVVDNASTDGTREFLEQTRTLFFNMKLIFNSNNIGVAAGRNVGWSEASREFILNIDDDTWLSVSDIYILLKKAQKHPDVGILSPIISDAISGRYQCYYGMVDYPVANFHGACHLVRTDLFRNIGELDAFCSFGGEELDYSIRARASGFDVLYTPVTEVKHNSIVRTGVEGRWRRRQWIFNFTRIFYKHFPARVATAFGLRYFLSHFISAIPIYGFIFTISLLGDFARGVISGRSNYKKIPKDVIKFYKNPKLRPDFGNKPLIGKCLSRYNSLFIH